MFVYAKVSDIENYIVNGVWKASWYDQYGWEYPWIYTNVMKYVRPGAKMLDVGAGTCQASEKLLADAPAGVEMHVIDSEESFNKLGARKPGLHYHLGLLGVGHDLPESSFDIIFSVSVIEHIHEAGGDEGFMKALFDMKRLLRPGGYMIHAMDIILDPEIYRRWKGFSIDRFIRALDMEILPEYLSDPPTREEMLLDPDLYVVSPQTTYELRWWSRQMNIPYFRLTGIGFILRKSPVWE